MQYNTFKLPGPPDDLPDAQAWAVPVFVPTPEALGAALLSGRIAEVKAIAGRRILSAYPLTRQNNMLARAAVLNANAQNDSSEALAIFEAWGWIDATRAHSDVLEAELQSASDPAAVNIWGGWPAHADLPAEVAPEA